MINVTISIGCASMTRKIRCSHTAAKRLASRSLRSFGGHWSHISRPFS
nr:MAG TPA_asm: hypothetical protein [Caudoviricetes sp.]